MKHVLFKFTGPSETQGQKGHIFYFFDCKTFLSWKIDYHTSENISNHQDAIMIFCILQNLYLVKSGFVKDLHLLIISVAAHVTVVNTLLQKSQNLNGLCLCKY